METGTGPADVEPAAIKSCTPEERVGGEANPVFHSATPQNARVVSGTSDGGFERAMKRLHHDARHAAFGGHADNT
jgi:hypothetical protein